jgi:hypothetical protein
LTSRAEAGCLAGSGDGVIDGIGVYRLSSSFGFYFKLEPPNRNRIMTSQKILLVEDNPDDRDLTIIALKGSSIANEIDIAGDGEGALQYFEDQSRAAAGAGAGAGAGAAGLKLARIMGL